MNKVININGQRFLLPTSTSAKDVAALAGFMVGLRPVQQEYDYDKREYMFYADPSGVQVQLEDMDLGDKALVKERSRSTFEAYQAKRAEEKANT